MAEPAQIHTPPARPFSDMPGDRGRFPVAGDVFEIVRNPENWMRRKQTQYGNIFWTEFMGMKQVALVGPEANQVMLLDRDKVFSSTWGWDWFIGKLFPRGLMLRDFDDHKIHRRVMQTAFRKEAMQRYVEILKPEIARGIEKWGTGTFGLKRQKSAVAFYPTIKSMTLDLATVTFMGEKVGKKADELNAAFVACVEAGGAWIKYPIPGLKYRKGLEGRKLLEDFFYSNIPAKRASEGEDIFSQLCHAVDEEGNRYTDQDVVDHMIFLMMAAHDTTTITLTTMMYELGKHPEWQERLRQESLDIGKPSLDYEDMSTMTGIELVMKESMRLIAPVPLIPRSTTREIELSGYRIPPQTLITASIDYTHRMPEYWPDPEKFDPERFAEDRREDLVHKYAFSPFGGGAHKCIGMHFADQEVKAVMHQILLKYRWNVSKNYKMELDFSSLPKPKDRLPIVLERI